MRFLPAMFVLLLLSGCALAPSRSADPHAADVRPDALTRQDGAWLLGSCAWSPHDVDRTLPDVIGTRLRDSSNVPGSTELDITRWEWDASAGAYRPVSNATESLGPRPHVDTVSFAGDLFEHESLGGYHSIVRRGPSLEKQAEARIERFGSMATDGSSLFVAASTLRSYTRELRLVQEIELPLKEKDGSKMAESIVILHGIAYLMDDFVFPLYVIRVDVGDPAHMRVIDRQNVTASHLGGQWIDPHTNQWNVIATFGGLGSASSWVAQIDLTSGSQRTIAMESIQYVGQNSTSSGHALNAYLPTAPQWAFVDADRFGRLDAGNGTLRFCAYANATSGTHSVDRVGDLVLAATGDRLYVADESTEPPMLLVNQSWNNETSATFLRT